MVGLWCKEKVLNNIRLTSDVTPYVPDTQTRIFLTIWCIYAVQILSNMSALDVLAAVCEVEMAVESIFYHTRRDWQRMHLRWQHDMEEVHRTGNGRVYSEPVLRSIDSIRKECYKNL